LSHCWIVLVNGELLGVCFSQFSQSSSSLTTVRNSIVKTLLGVNSRRWVVASMQILRCRKRDKIMIDDSYLKVFLFNTIYSKNKDIIKQECEIRIISTVTDLSTRVSVF
jgi:hypothetical protein